MRGTHWGCDTSNCGACTVILDGVAAKSCTVLAVQARGCNVTTIEGLAGPGQGQPCLRVRDQPLQGGGEGVEEALAVEVAERMVTMQGELEAERNIVSEYDASIENLRGAIRNTENQLRQLKQHPRLRVIPVVVLTTSDESADVTTAYQLGANSYIVKPVDFAAFLEVVAKIGLYWVLTNRVPE